jgi:hypothetical protein
MIRNLKAFGLALVAMAAFGSLMASGAQAAPTFDAETALEWHPTGTPLEEFGSKYTLPFGAEITCKKHLDPTQTYNGPTTKIRLTLTTEGCHAQILGTKYPVTVTHNGCETELHPTMREPDPPTTYTGDARLICPEGVSGVEIHIYNDAGHTSVRCTFTIKPQTTNGILTHNEPTDVKVTTNTVILQATKTSGSLLQCGGATQNGESHGDLTLTATTTEGNTIKATIAGE